MVTLGDWLGERPFALAMSSGFFSFFAHAGMLESLIGGGFSPRSVSGSSAGALAGGVWAAGVDAKSLAGELQRLRREDFWDPAVGAGFLSGRGFDRLLRQMLPVTAIRDCKVPVKISAFDILRRRTAVLDEGDLVHAIRASCAVPGLFHPVWIDRRPYWDGGILDRPGLAGLANEQRVLFHHIASKSPWRTKLGMPRRPGMITLVIEGLPRSGPFRLDAGRRALELARQATAHALDQKIDADGVVRYQI